MPLPSDPPELDPPTADELAAAYDLGTKPVGVDLVAVARSDGGQPLGDGDRREIFVYDEPFGDPRRLGPLHEQRLLHPDVDGASLVLPVHAGNQSDSWLQVVVPSSTAEPTIAWVNAADFDILITDRTAILTVLPDGVARIQVVRSGDLLFDEPLTWAPGASLEPFARVGWVHTASQASSASPESSDTWLDLRLARVDLSSLSLSVLLSIRSDSPTASPQVASMEAPALDRLAALLTPGTRVVVVQGTETAGQGHSFERLDAMPADTVSFDTPLVGRQYGGFAGRDLLWSYCDGSWCREVDEDTTDVQPTEPDKIGSFFLIAKPGAGLPYNLAEQEPSGTFGRPGMFPPPDDARIVEVFDRPGGEPRMLVYRNDVDQTQVAFPLVHPSIFGQPLVLRLVRGLPGDEWFEVQAPTRPTRRTVFVRAADFGLASTTTAIEIDARAGGELTLLEAGEPMLQSLIVSARESRPHTFHDTLIDQVFEAGGLGPVYGNWIATHNTWSEALGTFGGGLPGQTLHGTNTPELMDQAVTSGGIRVTNETMLTLVESNGIVEPWGPADRSTLLGASIVIYDGSSLANALGLLTVETWEPAETMPFDPEAIPPAPVPSYS